MTAAEVHVRQQIIPAAPAASQACSRADRADLHGRQAERRAAHARNWDCHGTTLDNGEFGGAPLNGSYFRRHWGGGSVAALYSKTRTTMPPDRPGQLTDQTYLDLTAFLLSKNGYAAGDKELPADLETQQKMSLKQ